jgi:hypothetical protein
MRTEAVELFQSKLELIEELAFNEVLEPKSKPKPCQHKRRKSTCKGCGTGFCQHGRRKSTCKDCGTGFCQHGRRNTTSQLPTAKRCM